MKQTILSNWTVFKRKIEAPKVRWSFLSITLLFSIVSSHFVFSNKVIFINNVAVSQTKKQNNINKFKIPVIDIKAQESVINLVEYEHSKGEFVVFHPEKNVEINKYGLNCNIYSLGDATYNMKCYNFNPESKGFGMYSSNTYKVSKIENYDIVWHVEKIKYKEVFLLSYLFGFIFWFAVFFWPIVFSKVEDEEKIVSNSQD